GRAVRAPRGERVDDGLGPYRRRIALCPSLLASTAAVVGLIDRDRLVSALPGVLTRFAAEPLHPVRRRIADLVNGLPERISSDVGLAARVDATARELLKSDVVGDLLGDVAERGRAALAADVGGPASGAVGGIGGRLD